MTASSYEKRHSLLAGQFEYEKRHQAWQGRMVLSSSEHDTNLPAEFENLSLTAITFAHAVNTVSTDFSPFYMHLPLFVSGKDSIKKSFAQMWICSTPSSSFFSAILWHLSPFDFPFFLSFLLLVKASSAWLSTCAKLKVPKSRKSQTYTQSSRSA